MKDYAKLWVGYTPKKNNRDCSALSRIVMNGASENDRIVKNAVSELKDGLKAMLDIVPDVTFGVAGTDIKVTKGADIQDREEYSITLNTDSLVIDGKSESGVLYAVFDILRTVACEKSIEKVYAVKKTVRPSNPLRMLNHWDNMDGSIER